MNWNCDVCGGKVLKKQVVLDYPYGQSIVLIEDVEIMICTQCGEKYIPGDLAKKIETLLTPENIALAKLTQVPTLTLR